MCAYTKYKSDRDYYKYLEECGPNHVYWKVLMWYLDDNKGKWFLISPFQTDFKWKAGYSNALQSPNFITISEGVPVPDCFKYSWKKWCLETWAEFTRSDFEQRYGILGSELEEGIFMFADVGKAYKLQESLGVLACVVPLYCRTEDFMGVCNMTEHVVFNRVQLQKSDYRVAEDMRDLKLKLQEKEVHNDVCEN